MLASVVQGDAETCNYELLGVDHDDEPRNYLLDLNKKEQGRSQTFSFGGALEGPVLQQGELSMVCVGLSERDLLQWHDVTRKIFGGQCPPLAPP